MRKAPAWKVAFALGVTMLGAAIMALVISTAFYLICTIC